MVRDDLHTPALIVLPVDQFSVQTVVGRHVLNYEIVVLFQGLAGRLQLFFIAAHEDDLIDRPAVIFRHGTDVQLLGQGFPPPDDLTVPVSGLFQEFTQVFVAPAGVFRFDGPENALFL